MPRINIEELRSVVERRLAPRFPDEHVQRISDIVMFGELSGRKSHGILRLLPGTYGVMDEEVGGVPQVERLSASSARVVGKQGMIVASLATDLAEEIATDTGFAVITTRGSRSTSGSLTFFAERLAEAGLVSMISAGTPDFVGLPGQKGRVLGTNPLVFGLPAERRPFVLDMATSAISGGDVLTAAASGADLPPGVAIDSEGETTVDPNDVLRGGAVLPFGGHKGLGLALMVEILNRALTGAEGDPGDWGHVFVAFSLSLVGDERGATSRVEREIDRLREAGARIPGYNTLARRDESLERGWVEVDDENYAKLLAVLD